MDNMSTNIQEWEYLVEHWQPGWRRTGIDEMLNKMGKGGLSRPAWAIAPRIREQRLGGHIGIPESCVLWGSPA
jgi:hypothetical protein